MGARILVVGGAGYIGSVCAHELLSAGHEVVNLDDLSTGHRAAAQGPLIIGDIRDRDLLRRLFAEGSFDAVLHFAARSLVGDSLRQPLHYYEVNVAGTIGLVQEMLAAGVRNLVFSSTCAIYGDPRWLPLDEAHPWTPVSPYGHSKAMVEQVLADCRAQEGLRVTTLRYFNAAGALPDGSLGESHRVESHLIPLALDAALGKRPPLHLHGTDYPTRDGTGVRDYIHVLDLAVAHRLALQRLLEGDAGTAYNVGTGLGTTVREVLAAVERAVGLPVPYLEGPRRPGDPPALYAQARRIQEELGWAARWTSIDDIVATAARWSLHRRF